MKGRAVAFYNLAMGEIKKLRAFWEQFLKLLIRIPVKIILVKRCINNPKTPYNRGPRKPLLLPRPSYGPNEGYI
jgi:hypothetical protein